MADNTAQNGTATMATEDVGGVHFQKIIPAAEPHASFRGRASTYRSVGRAGTTARRVLAIWNAAGSGVNVGLNQIAIDIAQTAAVAVTVIAMPMRVYRITAIPTGGNALTKVAKETGLSGGATGAAGVTLFQDVSADGTNSVTPLAATVTAGSALTSEFASRLITAAGFEMMDRAELLADKGVIIKPGEGLVLSLDITLATQEPAGVMTMATVDWYEYV